MAMDVSRFEPNDRHRRSVTAESAQPSRGFALFRQEKGCAAPPGTADNPSDRAKAPQNTYDSEAAYGPSSLDRRYNVTASYMCGLPWFQAQHGFAGQMLRGWEVSGLLYQYAGTPLTVITSNTGPGGLGSYREPSTCSITPSSTR